MIVKTTLQGPWTLSVIQKDADWDQRVNISGSANADGYYQYPGVLQTQSIQVKVKDLQPWTLKIDHNDGSQWSFNELSPKSPTKSGQQLTYEIASRDTPGSNNPFNDLVVKAEAQEAQLIEVPFRPYAVRIDTLQMMPEGIFETMLGTCYMAVRIRNKWTGTLPASSRVRVSLQGRKTLQNGGIQVVDSWSQDEQERLGQQVSGQWVQLGALKQGEMRTVYFKLNCAKGKARKHTVEFELEQAYSPAATSFKFTCEQKIFVSRSGYNPVTGEFYAECDRGTLFLRLNKMVVEYTTLRDAVICAREYRAKFGPPPVDRVRQILQDLLAGHQVDLCELRSLLDEACERDGGGDRWPCGEILMFPTEFGYRIEPNPAYAGQFGPLPYDDPFWKALLALLALILSLAAGASAAADLAYQSDDALIGTLFDSKLEKETAGPYQGYYLVDAALCELNGNRPLPSVTPPLQVLDAQSDDEENTTPVDHLDGNITLKGKGECLTNAEIDQYCKAMQKNPKDSAAVENALVFKSGARTGVTFALMNSVVDYPRNDNDGVYRPFKQQVYFLPIPTGVPLPSGLPNSVIGQAIAKQGDSGSLWIHWKTGKIVALHHGGPHDEGTHAAGTRIEDVMSKMNISFKK